MNYGSSMIEWYPGRYQVFVGTNFTVLFSNKNVYFLKNHSNIVIILWMCWKHTVKSCSLAWKDWAFFNQALKWHLFWLVKFGGRNVNNLWYSNDTTFLSESKEDLKHLIKQIKKESEKLGLLLNIKRKMKPVTSVRNGNVKMITDSEEIKWKIKAVNVAQK